MRQGKRNCIAVPVLIRVLDPDTLTGITRQQKPWNVCIKHQQPQATVAVAAVVVLIILATATGAGTTAKLTSL